VLLLFWLLPELPPLSLFEALVSPEVFSELLESDDALELPFPLPLSLLAETVSEPPSDFVDPELAGVLLLRA
jgi:hypothetical protein